MSNASVEAFLALRNPEPRRGQKVLLLRYSNSAIPGHTHEVREDRLLGFGLFFGSKKQCLQWMANNGLECTNLGGWGEQQLPSPQLLKAGA